MQNQKLFFYFTLVFSVTHSYKSISIIITKRHLFILLYKIIEFLYKIYNLLLYTIIIILNSFNN